MVTAVVAQDSVVVSADLASFRLLTILLDNTTDDEAAMIGFTVLTVVADAAVRGDCPLVALDILVELDFSEFLA